MKKTFKNIRAIGRGLTATIGLAALLNMGVAINENLTNSDYQYDPINYHRAVFNGERESSNYVEALEYFGKNADPRLVIGLPTAMLALFGYGYNGKGKKGSYILPENQRKIAREAIAQEAPEMEKITKLPGYVPSPVDEEVLV